MPGAPSHNGPKRSARYSSSPSRAVTHQQNTLVSGPSGPSANNISAFSNPIPWRKAGLRYKHNAIYFDIIETLDAVVNKYAPPPLSPGTIGTQPSFQERNHLHEQRSRQDRCKLQALRYSFLASMVLLILPARDLHASRNTRPTSHADQFTHHLRAVLPSLCPVRTHLIYFSPPCSAPTDERSPLPSTQTKPLFPIKSALLRPAIRGFYAHGKPLASKPGAAPALMAAAAAQLFTLRALLSIADDGPPSLPPLFTKQPSNY